MYGNKQRLDRHLGKEHPDEPENGSIDKSNIKHMEKLVTILGKDFERPPVAISGGDTGDLMHASVDAPQLSGLSPHGSSPGYFDNQQTQSPSSNDGAVLSLNQETGPPYPAASGNFPPGAADGYGVSPGSQAPRNLTTGPWNIPGMRSGPHIPYEQPYQQVEQSGSWSSNPVNHMNTNESMAPNLTPTSFNTQSTELNFSGPILTDEEYSSTYDPQQQYQYQHQHQNHIQTQQQYQGQYH